MSKTSKQLIHRIKETNQRVTYMISAIAGLSFPHRAKGRDFYQITNGRDTLTIQAGRIPLFEKNPKTKKIEQKRNEKNIKMWRDPVVPAGIVPRRIMIFLAHYWQRHKNSERKIVLGDNLVSFLKRLDTSKGGKTYQHYQEQIDRFFYSYITISRTGPYSYQNASERIAKKMNLLWSFDDDNDRIFFESYLIISELFERMLNQAIPIPFDILEDLGFDTYMFDLFVWQAKQSHSQVGKVLIDWDNLKNQFGYEGEIRFFKRDMINKFNKLNLKLKKHGIKNNNRLDYKKDGERGIWLKTNKNFVPPNQLSEAKKEYLKKYLNNPQLIL